MCTGEWDRNDIVMQSKFNKTLSSSSVFCLLSIHRNRLSGNAFHSFITFYTIQVNENEKRSGQRATLYSFYVIIKEKRRKKKQREKKDIELIGFIVIVDVVVVYWLRWLLCSITIDALHHNKNSILFSNFSELWDFWMLNLNDSISDWFFDSNMYTNYYECSAIWPSCG